MQIRMYIYVKGSSSILIAIEVSVQGGSQNIVCIIIIIKIKFTHDAQKVESYTLVDHITSEGHKQ